jgi:hypothetical protein
LPERHHVGGVGDEADGVDALARSEAADLTDLGEPAVALVQDGHEALALVPADVGVGARGAQHTVVLGQGELVEQRAAHLAAGSIRGGVRVGGVEAVDRGERVRRDHGAVESGGPLLRRHVQAAP